ncbi:hypothetical protein [Dyadobacter sediminis]|uniref:DUF2383 domain-containing protein n=1 Tax=Dyadobacter sediminis TaxID=1493691 RepID=A0A5R9KIC5_9BACT|nr:hypothetical protein [Dyadobacter sediminis]TLU95932.1 hypothetical protein FEM55_01920 [Dyadobacter sediminis]GGB77841.1 hypothetical protein GCM10011325_01660 [Dyadobacter sediminis]
MENVKGEELIMMIKALWNEQKNREILYLEALRKDVNGSFRRVLSQGHVSAVLFQREIGWIYDYFKCFLNDKELDEKISGSSRQAVRILEEAEHQEDIARCLKKNEATTLQLYKSLRGYMDKDSEARKVLDEHLARISEFYETLRKLEIGNRKMISYTVAA